MEKYSIISSQDLQLIRELIEIHPTIRDKFELFLKDNEHFSNLKRETRKFYKLKEKPPWELKEKVREFYPILQESKLKYTELNDLWYGRMISMIEKYEYTRLSTFLEDKPLSNSISKRPSFEFATNTKKITNWIGIPVIPELYGKILINNYPISWLTKVHEEILKYTTDKKYVLDLDKFKL